MKTSAKAIWNTIEIIKQTKFFKLKTATMEQRLNVFEKGKEALKPLF